VKNFVALTAIELVLATGLFQRAEMVWVALAALGDRQGLWINSIKAGILRRQVRPCCSLSQGGANRPGE